MICMRTFAAGALVTLALALSASAQERPTGYLAPEAVPDPLMIVGGPPA